MDFKSLSMVALHAVAPSAEHLKVLRHGLAAFRPRHDVIALHLPVIEMSVADRTDPLLQFIGRALVVFVKRAEVQFFAARPPRKQKLV